MMAEELQVLTTNVSSNITEMTQAHNCAQEHTGKFIENAISKTLAKTQCTTVSLSTTINTSTRNIPYASPTYDAHKMFSWPPTQPAVSFTSHVDPYQT